jgi:hypothetical protein
MAKVHYGLRIPAVHPANEVTVVMEPAGLSLAQLDLLAGITARA